MHNVVMSAIEIPVACHEFAILKLRVQPRDSIDCRAFLNLAELWNPATASLRNLA